jgi:AraC-like DNA-binding protein
MKMHYEKVLCPPTQSISTEDVIGPVIDCVLHVHREYELTYVASSRGTRFAGADISLFSEGSLSLYGPLLPHHYFSPLSDSLSKTWGHARVIKFGGALGDSLLSMPELEQVRKMLQASARGVDFPLPAARRLSPLIDSVFKASGVKRLSLFLELLDSLSRTAYRVISIGFDGDVPAEPDERINKVLKRIHDSLAEGRRISLKDASASASLSPEAFCRFFKKSTRKSFVSYINEMKLERACLKLMNSGDTVAQICYASGFNNLSNFNRQFIRRKGLSPSDYRKTFQKL